MINDSNKTELIELYLQGDIHLDQLKEFNAKLEEDEAFKMEVEIQQSITRNIRKAGQENLRMTLKSFHSEITEEEAQESKTINLETDKREEKYNIGKTNFQKYFYLTAASIALIILAGAGTLYSTVSNEGLYKQQIELYDIKTSRSDKSESTSGIIEFYQNKDYFKTIALFENQAQPTTEEIFLAGNAYLVLNDPAKAQKTFLKVIILNQNLPMEDQRFYDDAQYLLALSYLKNSQIKEAKELLVKIRNKSDHLYRDKVTDWFLFKLNLLDLKAE